MDGKETDGWEPTAHIRWFTLNPTVRPELQQMWKHARLGKTQWRGIPTYLSDEGVEPA